MKISSSRFIPKSQFLSFLASCSLNIYWLFKQIAWRKPVWLNICIVPVKHRATLSAIHPFSCSCPCLLRRHLLFTVPCSQNRLENIDACFCFLSRFLEDRSSPQCRFRDQQFWTGIKVLLSKKHFFPCVPHFNSAFQTGQLHFLICCLVFISY